MSPNRGSTTTLSLTVSGLNFATVDKTPSTKSASASCSTASWSSSSSVVCLQANYGTPADSSVIVTVTDGYVGTRSNVFTFDGSLSSPVM